ncbi:MAG: hypothetical protein H7327_12100, partial [Herminiimonas sp.]|nr:hypothetical protein [Herminiimonas sp.]
MRINSTWTTSIALLLAFAAGGAVAGDGERRNNRDEVREQRQAMRQERLRDSRSIQQQQPQQPQQSQQ